MCWTLLQSLSQLLSGCRPLVSFVYAELDLLVPLLWSLADLASCAEDSPLKRIKLIDIGIFCKVEGYTYQKCPAVLGTSTSQNAVYWRQRLETFLKQVNITENIF